VIKTAQKEVIHDINGNLWHVDLDYKTKFRKIQWISEIDRRYDTLDHNNISLEVERLNDLNLQQ
jgi:hypothetical protein